MSLSQYTTSFHEQYYVSASEETATAYVEFAFTMIIQTCWLIFKVNYISGT
jgi:hypothetical protein